MTNKFSITLGQFREQMGLEDEDEYFNYLRDAVFDGIVHATCEMECIVEPDGTCEHGNKSVLLIEGIV